MRLLYFVGKYGQDYMANHVHEELVGQFASLGYNCTIASLAKPGQKSWRSRSGPLSLEYVQVQAGTIDKVLSKASHSAFAYDYLLAGAARLRRLIQSCARPDVVHADMVYPYGTMAALACLGSKIPLVVSARGGDLIDSPESHYGYCRHPSARRLVRFTFARSAAVRANSPLMARTAAERGCDPAKIRIVPPNVGVELVRDPANLTNLRVRQREEVLRRTGIQPAHIVLSAGRIIPIKGIEYLVQAMPRVLSELPGTVFVVAGPSQMPAYTDSIVSLATDLGVRQNLIMPGQVDFDDMQTYFAASDVFVVSSLVEGLHKGAIEAASVGTPTVATSTAGVATYLEAAQCGLVVNPKDPNALGGAIVRLLRDKQMWEAMSKRSLELAEQFTVERTARGMHELFQWALGGSVPVLNFETSLREL